MHTRMLTFTGAKTLRGEGRARGVNFDEDSYREIVFVDMR
jgi:hypothetical protein